MAFFEAWSLRKRLIVLVLSTLLPVAFLGVAGLVLLAEQQHEQTGQSMTATVRAVMTAVDSEVENTVSALQTLGTARSLAGGDFKTFYEDAQRVMAMKPSWATVVLFGPNKEYLLNLREPWGTTLPHSTGDPDSLDLAIKERKPRMGRVLIGQLSKRAVIAVRVPIVRDGEVRYVLSVPLKPESLLDRIASNEIVRGGGVVSVVDMSGNIAARTRGFADFVGKPTSSALKEMMAKAPEGWGPSINLDGQATYSAYTRSEFSGLTVAMGLPREGFIAPWRRSYAALGAGILLALMAAVGVALLIASRINGPIRDLSTAARALGRGEQPAIPTTGMPEVRHVGEALMAAAAARASAEAQREHLLERERAARAAAEAASRGKDEFLAMLGHELRNPLGAITNSAMLLDDRRLSADQRASAVAVIRRQSAQLKHLIDDLLDVGRVMTGKIYIERQRIDIAQSVESAVAALAAARKSSQHKLAVETSAASVDADPTRVDQIVTNLLANALHHTPPGGAIRVTVREVEDRAELVVADNGDGISPAVLPRVFDLFFQGPQPVDRPQSGLGIGLTLVKRLVELHGGTISAASGGPGKGATFTVTLPLAAGNIREAAKDEPASPQPALDILIVEDNDDSRDSLRLLLELQGHRVRTAADGNAGVAASLESRFDVALVDIGLPGLDGYGVARAIRAARGHGVRLIALTGYGSEHDAGQALSAGFDLHMTKPVDFDQLAGALACTTPQ